MSLLQNSNAIESGGYNINNSLRFRSSASATLSRTPSTAGNRSTWTWSAWIKRGRLTPSNGLGLFGSGTINSGSNETSIRFTAGDALGLGNYRVTTRLFRDPSAWYHIVVAFDTTQATGNNRVKMYVNGVEETSFSTLANPTLNSTADFINSTTTHYMGVSFATTSLYDDRYQAETYFIDGQALTPSSFGETDTTTGVWKPKAYTGTYGTNGFYLKFSDIATTSGSNAGLGKDFSGNGNYWTTNNISVTAGTTYDAMTDSPTLTSATVANYATFAGTNLGTYANATITEAGLKVSVSSGGTPDGGKAYAPFGMSDGSGKWYFEMTCVDPGAGNQRLCFGIANITTNPNAVAITNGYYASASGAHGNYNIGTFTTNDILQVAYDSGSNKLWFGKNGTWYNSGDPAAGTTPLVTVTSGITYAPFSTYASSGQGPGVGAWNFGQRPFAYTPPTGFSRLNAYNLPDSTIKKGNSYMDAKLYTGTNANQSINTYGFSPDLIWIKNRDNVEQHHLVDSVRGNNKFLLSNSTAAERTGSLNNGYNQVNLASTGFDIVSNGLNDELNLTGRTYVAWGWDANGAGSSNTNGSITSTVSVNTTAGFSIVTYTGTGSVATVGHGLGVAPRMIIAKGRTNVDNWPVGHTSRGWDRHILLNGSAAEAVTGTTWNNTAPTSTVFTVGTDTRINQNTITYVAYCWAEIAGFSKFGSYTGNGSTDGPFVFTGFRPKLIIIKQSSAAGENWVMYDTVRNTYNVANLLLHPNLSNAESTTTLNPIDILSNGFKLRGSSGLTNTSSATYIYMAFAENPFKYSLAR